MGAIDRRKRVAHDRRRGYAERGYCPRFLPFQFFDHTLTHGHPDHFFGLTFLLQRFPQARAVARPNVVGAMRTAVAPDIVANNWSRRWRGQIPERLTIAAELHAERFDLEGHEIRVIDTGHTDTDDTTRCISRRLGS
jgi:metal-dependent hydrolase (beta-lactamase superfamily II)